MAFLGQEFDTSAMPESESNFDPLPPGWYSAIIAKSELRQAKSGGEYIWCQYDIIGPTHEGRVVFGNLNIRNPNPTAEKIGLQQFRELMGAIGLQKVRDTDQLIGGRLQIKLAIKTDPTGRYEPSNEVKAFKAIKGSAPPAPVRNATPPSFTAPAAAPSSPPAKSAPPWAKKTAAAAPAQPEQAPPVNGDDIPF